MAFIVEDGTGLPNATSLIDVAYADDYFSTRGNTEWAALSTSEKEAALVKGTDYINGKNWKGVRLEDTQRLDFPRDLSGYNGNIYDHDVYDSYRYSGQYIDGDTSPIPDPIKTAVCEYALESHTTTLYTDVQDPQNVQSTTDTIEGAVSTSVTYKNGSSSTQKRFGKPEAMIRPYILTTQMRLVR